MKARLAQGTSCVTAAADHRIALKLEIVAVFGSLEIMLLALFNGVKLIGLGFPTVPALLGLMASVVGASHSNRVG